MNATAYKFFVAAAFFGLVGMAWGIAMSATGDHSLSPAHGHLNLIGFVAFAIYGSFYHLVPAAADNTMGRVHFWLALVAVLILVPGIVMALTEQGETLAKIGSLLALLSGLVFLVQVATQGRRTA